MLDKLSFDIKCPNCNFFNTVYFKQARLNGVIICRGCKINIRLNDQMNECRKARERINRGMEGLKKQINKINNMKITIRL